ncbi:MAG: hypothetical protein ABJJ53_18685 [Sulfitobacter sp.]
MIAAVSLMRSPCVALLYKGIARFMDIILHVGAHRTGSTSFQHYLRGNRARLAADGTAVWEPRELRRGLLDGLFTSPRMQNGRNLHRRAVGRVRLKVAQVERTDAQRLLISEENIIGAPRACLRAGTMYPAIGERMARLETAFDGRISRVVMCVRVQDLWWSSVAAFSVARGHAMPDAARFDAIATAQRTWRDVITDLACALPQVELKILPFEQYAGQFDKVLTQATGRPAPSEGAESWLNRSLDADRLRAKLKDFGVAADGLPTHLAEGEGRWKPFSDEQTAELREAHADDMMWLAAGADGLATLTEDPSRTRANLSLPSGVLEKGQSHDQEPNDRVKGRLAQTG